MASVFTKIIDGELPGRFVWRDDAVVAFLSINPIQPGHTLVVPRVEVSHWTDLDPTTWMRCTAVSQWIGQAIAAAFSPPRVGSAIAGFEVPHTHIHVLQLHDMADLDFARAQADPDPAQMDDAAVRIRQALTGLGHSEFVG